MPGEVSPRADRETQESEFYFTDHSLTGQSTSFLYCWPPPCNHAELFSTIRTLTGKRPSVPGVESRQVTARLRVGLSGNVSFARCSPSLFHRSHFDWGTRVSSLLALGVTSAANHPWQLHRQIFFTECILTGGSASCPPPSILHAGRPASSPHEAHQLFLTIRTLTGSRASVLRRGIGQRHCRNPARGPITAFLASIGNRRLFGVMRPSRLRTNFFSPITL